MVTDGNGWSQEEGKQAMPLKKGSIVKISAGVKHWHGASENSRFTHIALEDWSKGQPEWLEPVSQEDYEKLEDTDVG